MLLRVSPRFPRIRVFNGWQVPPQRFAEHRPTPIDLAQGDVAASLGDREQAIEPLDVVECSGQGLDHEVVHGPAARRQKRVDPLDGLRFTPHVRLEKRFRPLDLGLRQDLVRVPSGIVRRCLTFLIASGSDRAYGCASSSACSARSCSGDSQNVRKIFRQRCRKIFRVGRVIEPVLQELVQRVMQAGLQQGDFQATPPPDLPFQNTTSATNSSSMTSTGLTAAHIRPTSSS